MKRRLFVQVLAAAGLVSASGGVAIAAPIRQVQARLSLGPLNLEEVIVDDEFVVSKQVGCA